jgi:hypothetical protein
MSTIETNILTVNYLDGESKKFECIHATETTKMLSLLQDALKQNMMFISLKEKVVAIPFYNLKSIELSPLPPKLPSTAIIATRQLET